MSGSVAIALITAVVILSVVVFFDRRALADLASTNDRDLSAISTAPRGS